MGYFAFRRQRAPASPRPGPPSPATDAAPLRDRVAALEGDNAALRGRVAELEALLATATAPGPPPEERRARR